MKFKYEKLDRDFNERFKELLREEKEKLEELLLIEGKTYKNFVEEIEHIKGRINLFTYPMNVENSVYRTEIGKKLYQEYLKLNNEFNLGISQREDIYTEYKNIYEGGSLNQVQKRFLEKILLGFKQSGIGLERDKKEEVKEITRELSALSSEFSKEVVEERSKYELIIEDEKVIEEMPERDLLNAKVEKGYRFTLSPASYNNLLEYCSSREIREEIYRAGSTLADKNAARVEKILTLRKRFAEILGYKNYAELSIDQKTADSTEAVMAFIGDLVGKSRKKAREEMAELEKAGRELNIERVMEYDIQYLSRLVREKKYSFDEGKLKPYFELNVCLKGLFDFLDSLYGIKFIEEEAELWDGEAFLYRLERKGRVLGKLIFDLKVRENKNGGAWAYPVKRPYLREDGTREPGLGQIACNFERAEPSLLTLKNVVTLFHEMGHALYYLTSTIDENISISMGERDITEYPSQWLEAFARNIDVLQKFGKHHETGEVVPSEYIKKALEMRNFGSAIAMRRQLKLGLMDLNLHMNYGRGKSVKELIGEARKETLLYGTPLYNTRENTFNHIFSGGYAAGYYSYKWAEVLSADSYFDIVKDGKIDNKLADRFYEEILARGGAEPTLEAFKSVHRREPEVDALLRINGILSGE